MGDSSDDEGKETLQYKVPSYLHLFYRFRLLCVLCFSDVSDSSFPIIQVILLGDGTVGKTSICHRFTNDTFQREYKQTIGLDFFLKRFELEGDVQVALQVWDIGGQSIGSKMLGNYIYGSHAIVFAYDCTNFQSFTNIEDWHKLVSQVFAGKSSPAMVLMANKVDMGHLRAVSLQKHSQFATERGMTSFFVSAKSGDNICPAFFTIASNLAGVPVKKTHLEANQVSLLHRMRSAPPQMRRS
jgi:Ras-related protein Rab-28